MAQHGIKTRAMMNLLDRLSGQEGHGDYHHFRELWCTDVYSPASIYEAAEAVIAPLPEDPTRTDKEQRREAVAVECERIAADPEALVQAKADHPQQALSTKTKLYRQSGPLTGGRA